MVNDQILRLASSGGGPAAVGDLRDGGIVFWVDPADDTHGMVMDINYKYACFWDSGNPRTFVGGTDTAIGTGLANTNRVVSVKGSVGQACWVAYNYEGQGYDDWFCPSKDEWEQILLVKGTIDPIISANGGVTIGNVWEKYWTSSETSASSAWNWNSQNNVPYQYDGKDQYLRARVARAF